jgi:hypothetical protein
LPIETTWISMKEEHSWFQLNVNFALFYRCSVTFLYNLNVLL